MVSIFMFTLSPVTTFMAEEIGVEKLGNKKFEKFGPNNKGGWTFCSSMIQNLNLWKDFSDLIMDLFVILLKV